jgi:uncharacterized protein with HEPN domain
MWPRDEWLALEHMLDHAKGAIEASSTRRREDLDSDWQLRLALIKAVEVVGEAANRVSRQTQARFPEIPWREAITTRNRLSHGYDTVDLDQLWDTVMHDLPPLVAALERALSELGT